MAWEGEEPSFQFSRSDRQPATDRPSWPWRPVAVAAFGLSHYGLHHWNGFPQLVGVALSPEDSPSASGRQSRSGCSGVRFGLRSPEPGDSDADRRQDQQQDRHHACWRGGEALESRPAGH